MKIEVGVTVINHHTSNLMKETPSLRAMEETNMVRGGIRGDIRVCVHLPKFALR